MEQMENNNEPLIRILPNVIRFSVRCLGDLQEASKAALIF